MKLFFEHQFKDKRIFQIPALVGSYDNYVYMIEHNGKAWVFDPPDDRAIQKTLEENNLHLEAILVTHHHHDHVGGIEDLIKKWSCPVYGHSKDAKRIPFLSTQVNAGDELSLGPMKAQIQYYPGHTLGLIAYYFKEENWLFSNDLIFSFGCGRVFEGSPQQMQQSLNQLRQLPEETLLMISHEYTKSNLDFALSQFPQDPKLLKAQEDIEKKLTQNLPTVPTTIGFEKKHNPFLRWDDSYIREILHMEDSEDWQVFAEIRTRKDIS